MISRLVIIPARGNSKRIKNKNIKNFCGKPIIHYSLKEINKSKLFKKIFVSTDSKRVSKIVNKSYIDFFRPKKLSGDKISTLDVIKHVVETYEKKKVYFDEIWCVSACAPLMTARDLKKASNLLKNNKGNIIISVSSFNTPIEWAFEMNKDKKLKPVKKGSYKMNSQNFHKKYFDTGDFICMKYDFLKKLKKNTNLDNFYKGLEIPKHRAVDIDYLDDWKHAETIFRGINY